MLCQLEAQIVDIELSYVISLKVYKSVDHGRMTTVDLFTCVSIRAYSVVSLAN